MKVHHVAFADAKVEKEYKKLGNQSNPEKNMKRYVDRALDDLKKNPSCGTPLPKKLIPKKYKQKGVDNLWKYNLPNAWRLLYYIKADSVTILAIVLDWMDHKSYEKKFKYKVR